MESSLNHKLRQPKEFQYSSSLALKIIYEAYLGKKISKEEKLKLKNYLVNKNELIELIKHQYSENDDKRVDWGFVKEKLKETSDKQQKRNGIIFRSYKAKELKETRVFIDDDNDDDENSRSFKYNLIYNLVSKKEVYYKRKKNDKFVDASKKNLKNALRHENQYYSLDIKNEQSKNAELNYDLNAESNLLGIANKKYSMLNNKDLPLCKARYNKKESKLARAYTVYNNCTNKTKKMLRINNQRVSNSEQKTSCCEDASNAENSLDINFNSDSIFFNYGEDSRGFISDEEEIKNLSTTAGLENAYFESISNINKNNNSTYTNNNINLTSTPIKKADYPCNLKCKQVSLFKTETKTDLKHINLNENENEDTHINYNSKDNFAFDNQKKCNDYISKTMSDSKPEKTQYANYLEDFKCACSKKTQM